MENDFRFNDASRSSRLVQAALVIVLAWLFALVLPLALALRVLLHPLQVLEHLRRFIDECIALVWYSVDIIRVNWKD